MCSSDLTHDRFVLMRVELIARLRLDRLDAGLAKRLDQFRSEHRQPLDRLLRAHRLLLSKRQIEVIDHGDELPGGLGGAGCAGSRLALERSSLRGLVLGDQAEPLLLRIGEIAPGPIVCYGPYWEEMLGPLLNHRYTHRDYLPLLRFAHTPAEVVQAVQSYSPESITWTRHS